MMDTNVNFCSTVVLLKNLVMYTAIFVYLSQNICFINIAQKSEAIGRNGISNKHIQ